NYYEILRLILRGMTGREGESLAQPSASVSSLIEEAMPKLDLKTDEIKFETPPKNRHAVSLKAIVEGVIVYPQVGDGPPEARISVVLDLRGADEAAFIEELMAMFWSELA